MVYKERSTQSVGRVARALQAFGNAHFHALSSAHETEEANMTNSAEVRRGFSRNEELNTQYEQYKAQLMINRLLIR